MNAQLAAQLAEYTQMLCGLGAAADVAARFNCTEIEGLVGLLAAAGQLKAAEAWLAFHAAEDEALEDDRHVAMTAANIAAHVRELADRSQAGTAQTEHSLAHGRR